MLINKRFRSTIIFIFILMPLLLCACNGNTASPSQTVEPAISPAIATANPEATPSPAIATLQIPQIDSSTARIPITGAIYTLFTEKYGYTGPEPICSKTHGAWLNLADSKADIVFLVAPTADELAYFAEKNVDIEMKIYGYDGLVFMGNKSNPVNNLTSDQIRSIYSGKIANWEKVQGENADMVVYIRNAESGSQRLFESLVWAGYDMPDFSKMQFVEGDVNPTVTTREATITVDDDMGTVTENVLLNQYAIGFNIMSYIDSEFANSELKLFSVDGVEPTTENFASGKYPFLTTSYIAIRANEPSDSPARMLYDWVGSAESYDLISQNSTLTVSFSDSVFLNASAGTPSSGSSLPETIKQLNQKILSRQDIMHFSLDELGYLRNGVFALSGRIFNSEMYANYFAAQSWYEGTSKSDQEISKEFNAFQTANLELIIAYEKELKNALANK